MIKKRNGILDRTTIIKLICTIVVLANLTGCTKSVNTSSANNSKTMTHVVTDMKGRKVTIPKSVNKVLSLSNNTTVDIYTIAPDKLAGLSFELKDAAKKYIDEKYYKLPVVGTTSDKKIDYESILKIKPDLIVCSEEDQPYAADEIQKQLKIPVVMVSANLEDTEKVYTFLGECLGEQKRAKELSDYSKKALANVKAMVKKIPEDKKVNVYYAEGASWLQTDISGNIHTEVLDIAGAKNVADIAEAKIGSMATVSMEQVMSWNPDVILEGATAAKGKLYSSVSEDQNWTKINAVKNNKYYKIPALPFNLVDRPPSAVRVLGVQWLSNMLYPGYVEIDMSKEFKDFYKLFYNYTLTDEDLKELLNHATS
ncbi:ABC transporter substrate-binding protein [Clostridium algoriphilum]|uniref:ABC transporter substrate-binding protein n=1 Tax=Clostridium algoriphilum TaxID=198347 RepID=UPI001CF34F95|nr:ABC transporter substrate-binding protein [Clostridium algoriphilum]MCB2293349.1 ABC transporter substrate-binding protein [Clostridium algoriphilum]